ncbi:hypothetical protein H2O64_06635 [Kordia sp. YSTF-M3]|uniref:Uncharacterized protein n=1 Tax=Kordia aestuariivivens TaxID=2759037 RepID=A0ABR7Q708_9FLAO|nr:hypothetical protein [Kordia aestuariivivens]MBC8754340.1 hypothetical protein [Kordia aestuariivivens]
MTQENHIVDAQLPLELDFKSLKAEGLAYIQKHSSTEWSNLNPSDPGVTILEQLCYAFTELGYCANFSMKDILTQKNGDLTMENQFYEPQNILTTSPITIEDYTKYIIDQIESVKNVIISPIPVNFPFMNGVYKVYLLIDPTYDDPTVTDSPTTETFYVLNSARNVGELFLMPQLLSPKTYTISGDLKLKSGYDINTMLTEMIQTINQYIFPDVTETGYDKLKAEGETTNEIFNGPTLQNGWIPSESIQPKKDTIQPFEITKLIQDIEGVQSISKIAFTYNEQPATSAICDENEILTFDFSTSFSSGKNTENLQISTQGKPLNATLNTSLIDELANMQQSSAQINEVAAVQVAPTLPTGKFRDITSYYSIQNTFPEAYAVGLNAVNDNTPDFQVAQSRQLKGYLSLFDQLLSNQFAQLANIDKLFSFKNAITGAPADLEHYNNIKTPQEKATPKYPAPFEVFSPTYFYQSLYTSVPNVEPLLRNNQIFNFGPISQSETALAHENWLQYQDDPYNSYMYGLLVFTEKDTVNLQRRNELLDHLLARHGESPLVIDTLIYGTVYSGDVLKDAIIIKSVYLQNLGILSYNRTKAYNSIGAKKLQNSAVQITPELLEELSKREIPQTASERADELQYISSHTAEEVENYLNVKSTKKELQNILTHTYKNNGVFNIALVNEKQKITKQDCLDYATLSLKLSLLLTLRPFYINFIQESVDPEAYLDENDEVPNPFPSDEVCSQIEVALWMIMERKGMISIETNLLLQSGSFEVLIQEGTSPFSYYRINTMINYADFITLSMQLDSMTTQDMQTYLHSINADYTLEGIDSSTVTDATFTAIENTMYAWTASVTWDNQNSLYITDSLFENTLLWIFPDFIKDFSTSTWQQRLSYFMECQLPIELQANPLYATVENMQTLIPLYVSWFNANIYNATTESYDTTLATSSAGSIITLLKELKTTPPESNA